MARCATGLAVMIPSDYLGAPRDGYEAALLCTAYSDMLVRAAIKSLADKGVEPFVALAAEMELIASEVETLKGTKR